MTTVGTFLGIDVTVDDTMPPGVIGYRRPDGTMRVVVLGACPGRVGDDADWCDTHGGTTAVCTVCDARVAVTSWATPFADVSLWLIGAHDGRRAE